MNLFLNTESAAGKSFPIVVVTCVTLLLLMLCALVAVGGDYTLEYAMMASGGALSQTTNYEVVDLMKNNGVEEAVQSSSLYSIEPTTGYREGFTAEWDWMFY